MKNIGVYIYFIILFFCYPILKSQNIYTYAGTGGNGNTGDGGPATFAQIGGVVSVAVDGLGNVYLCDALNGRIRKIDINGIISTFAGGGVSVSEGIAATATYIYFPLGITVDGAGNVYFIETSNNQVRKINTSGIITTVAGAATTSGGFSGDGGPAISATLNHPYDLAIDATGNIYIADQNNNRIRMVNTSGIINTIAGYTFAPGFSGDGGPATSAGLSSPKGVDVDASGNVYIADYNNYRIRKINTSGIISSIAGTGTNASTGDGNMGIASDILSPINVKSDNLGNIYITESTTKIRQINSTGIITTVAGTTNGYSGDGGPATVAQIAPYCVGFDSNNNMYIADGLNYRVRIVCNNSCVNGLNELDKNMILNIYPNPSSGKLKLLSQNLKDIEHCIIKITDVLGREVLVSTYNDELDMTLFEKGVYFLSLYNKHQLIEAKKVIKE